MISLMTIALALGMVCFCAWMLISSINRRKRRLMMAHELFLYNPHGEGEEFKDCLEELMFPSSPSKTDKFIAGQFGPENRQRRTFDTVNDVLDYMHRHHLPNCQRNLQRL